ncbi:hypothetical protein CMK11_06135 [Candidatus Poribacteria bacterium]|jgi:hypothetical protein|nr:hypothetical protein [Candidatus Poribacteria bacterium]
MARHPSDDPAESQDSSRITGLDADFIAHAVSHFDEQRARMAALEEAMSALLARTLSMERGLKVTAVGVGIAVGSLASLLQRLL